MLALVQIEAIASLANVNPFMTGARFRLMHVAPTVASHAMTTEVRIQVPIRGSVFLAVQRILIQCEVPSTVTLTLLTEFGEVVRKAHFAHLVGFRLPINECVGIGGFKILVHLSECRIR